MAALRLFIPGFASLTTPKGIGSSLGLAGLFLAATISLPGCDSDSGADSVAGGGAGGDSAVLPSADGEPAAPEFRPLPGDGLNDNLDTESASGRLDPSDPNYNTYDGFVGSTGDLRESVSGAGGSTSYKIGSASTELPSTTLPSTTPDGGTPTVVVDAGSPADAGSDSGSDSGPL